VGILLVGLPGKGELEKKKAPRKKQGDATEPDFPFRRDL
jgi:hypothetical protein